MTHATENLEAAYVYTGLDDIVTLPKKSFKEYNDAEISEFLRSATRANRGITPAQREIPFLANYLNYVNRTLGDWQTRVSYSTLLEQAGLQPRKRGQKKGREIEALLSNASNRIVHFPLSEPEAEEPEGFTPVAPEPLALPESFDVNPLLVGAVTPPSHDFPPHAAQRFDYKTVLYDPYSADRPPLWDILRRYSKQGWRLVQVLYIAPKCEVIFERPV